MSTETRRTSEREDDEMQVGNRSEHRIEGRAAADADQAIDRGSSRQVEVDMPPQREDWLAMGTVPDVMDPMITGEHRERRSETVLQEGVGYQARRDESGMAHAPIEATQGFSLERLQARDAAKAAEAAKGDDRRAAENPPGNDADSGEKDGNNVRETVETVEAEAGGAPDADSGDAPTEASLEAMTKPEIAEKYGVSESQTKSEMIAEVLGRK